MQYSKSVSEKELQAWAPEGDMWSRSHDLGAPWDKEDERLLKQIQTPFIVQNLESESEVHPSLTVNLRRPDFSYNPLNFEIVCCTALCGTVTNTAVAWVMWAAALPCVAVGSSPLGVDSDSQLSVLIE